MLRAKSRTGVVNSRPALRWQRTQLVFWKGNASAGFQPSGSLSGFSSGGGGAFCGAEPVFPGAVPPARTSRRKPKELKASTVATIQRLMAVRRLRKRSAVAGTAWKLVYRRRATKAARRQAEPRDRCAPRQSLGTRLQGLALEKA